MHHGRPVSSRLMPPYTHLGSVKVCPIATMLELRITEFSSRTEKWSQSPS